MRPITPRPAYLCGKTSMIGAICLLAGSVAIAEGRLVSLIPPASAQTIGSAPLALATTEPTGAAVPITSAADAVQKFTAENQLYIKGSPLTADQVQNLQTILQQHPNIYVVLIDTTSNVSSDDMTLSRGIGNSTAFQSVQNPELGERAGVLFMVYFDSDQGRQIFMRAEALPDRLGVGEANFADPSGNPRELLRLFVNAVQGEGKDVPGALEIVMQRINGTIQQHVQDTVQTASQTIQQVETELTTFQDTFQAFRTSHALAGATTHPSLEAWQQQLNDATVALNDRQFGEAQTLATTVLEQIQAQAQALNDYKQGPTIQQVDTELAEFQNTFKVFQARHFVEGPLGNPNVEAWQQQLNEAKTALNNYQFEEARNLASEVLEQTQAHEQVMGYYSEAPALAQTISQTLDTIQQDLSTLPENRHTQAAAEILNQARQSFANYESQYQAGSLDFGQPLLASQQQAEDAIASIAASRELAANRQNLRYLLLAMTGLGSGTVGLFTNRRASRRRRQAEHELAEAKAEIGAKAQELITLMDQVNYATLADYTGKTDQMAQELVERVINALTLVGGAEKFLAEAEALIQGHRLVNTFRLVNYDRAIALLTNSETTLTFGLQDSVRTAMTQGSTADSWRQSLLQQDASRRFEKSLRDVLLAMAENRDRATELLAEITSKDQQIASYLTQIETEANALRPQVQALQEQSQPTQPFRLEAVADTLLPMILEEGGLIVRGRAAMHQDPVRAWDDFGDLAKRMTQDTATIITVAQNAWQNLVPTLDQAHQALQSHGVDTRWAYQQQHTLSETLDGMADLAIRVPIAERSQQTQQDIAALEAQIKLVVDQDQARREACPNLITAATTEVAQARQDIHDMLKQAGVFLQGTVQQVLREPERDPSDRIDDAIANLEQIKPYLNQGDTEMAATCITNIETLTQAAHDLVQATRKALELYADTLQERQQRNRSIQDSIGATFQLTLQRIQDTYAAEVLQLVAPEVDAGNTIADNIHLAHNLIQKAQTLSQSAQNHYQHAHLLTSRDRLNDADRVLKGAQHQLDALTNAEGVLQQHQQNVEAELASLTESMSQLRVAAQAEYVRHSALELVNRATQAFAQAEGQVHQQPYHPYASQTCLTETETLRSESVAAIAADQKAYERAQATLQSAQRTLTTAEADVHRAQSTRFRHARVYTDSAERSLGEAKRHERQAQIQFSDRAYEDAQHLAELTASSARVASQAAAEAIASARRKHDAEVRRRDEEERRRRAAMYTSSGSSSSSFSSGGGSSSSGSSGGGFGGGGSGSSGGGW